MTTAVEAKASELAGAALDWAVAKAEGEKLVEVELHDENGMPIQVTSEVVEILAEE